MPRTPAVIRATSETKNRLNQMSLFFGQLPTSSHCRTQRCSEHLQNAANQGRWVFMRPVLEFKPKKAQTSRNVSFTQKPRRYSFLTLEFTQDGDDNFLNLCLG